MFFCVLVAGEAARSDLLARQFGIADNFGGIAERIGMVAARAMARLATFSDFCASVWLRAGITWPLRRRKRQLSMRGGFQPAKQRVMATLAGFAADVTGGRRS